MYKYIIHISDIHIRWESDREEEYSLAFDNTFKLIKKNAKENVLILFTGDLIHCKTKITPIVLSLVNKLITGLSECGDVVLIAGNHDLVPGDVDSKYLLDVIRRPKNVTYIDRTGEYTFDNVTIGASTLADNKFISFDELEKKDNELVLAMGHYTLKEWLDERKIQAYDRVKCVDDFKGYKYACLGDIHSRKSYENCKYAGSLIQQNFSETGKHGFSVLNIQTDKWKKITVPSNYTFKNVHVSDEGILNLEQDFTEYSYIKLHIPVEYINNESTYKKEIEGHTQVKRYIREIISKKKSPILNDVSQDRDLESTPLNDEEILRTLTNDKGILELHKQFRNDDNKYVQNKNKWVLKTLSFENVLKYRGKHSIDFDDINGIIGISGLNASGKSSLLKILIFSLSGEISIDFSLTNSDYIKTSQSYNHYKFDTVNLLNYDTPIIKKGYTEVEFTYEDKLFKIHRFIERKGPTVSTNTSIHKKNSNDAWEIVKSSLPKYKDKIPEKDVNKIIYNMIGRSSDLFLLNIINKNTNSFTDINDVSRFNIFSNIFNLNVYSDISSKVKNKIDSVKEDIIKSRGKKEQVETPVTDSINNIDIEECKKEISNLEKEKKILNNMRNNYTKDGELKLVNKNTDELKELYTNLVSARGKFMKKIQHNIPDGEAIPPTEDIAYNTLIKTYQDLGHVEKVDFDIPDIDDLPEPLKTNVSLEEVNKINEDLIKYNYDCDIDDIITEENQYKKILVRYNRPISNNNIDPKIKKIDKLCQFDVSPEKFKLTMAERDLKNIKRQELVDKTKSINKLPLKHIKPSRYNADTMKDLQELLDISIGKLHKLTDISDIIERLRNGKLNGKTDIARLEKLSTIDEVVIEISSDVSDANSRMKQLAFDNRFNKERDEDIKYNKKVEDDERELKRLNELISEYDKYLHNNKLKELDTYLTELERRLTYIEKYNKFQNLKWKYLQNISYLREQKNNYEKKNKYESYIRFFNADLTQNIKTIDSQLADINYTADKNTEKINKNISELETKINAKESVKTINKSLDELQKELDKLEIYNKLVKEDIKLVILSKYLSQVSEFANQMLVNLVDFTIELVASSNTNEKSNKVKLNIIRNSTISSSSLSAFEDFALTLILKVVLNIYNNNATATFLILDETLECIDYKNRDKIEDLFKMLRNKYQHIMLITHIESYYEKCQHKIEVSNGSLC